MRTLWTLLVIVLALSPFISAPPAPAAEEKIDVVATLLPYRDMARMIGDGRVSVELLLPPGASPHTWEPRAGDMIRLEEARLLIVTGGGFEPWLTEMVPHKVRMVQAVDQPLAHPHEHGRHHGREGLGDLEQDPHIWLDFERDIEICERIFEAMTKISPKDKPLFQQGRDRCRERFNQLHLQYKRGLKNCRSRTLVVAGHAAFGRVAKKYGLDQEALDGLSPDALPSPARMAQLVDLVKSRGIKAIFFESSVSPRLAKTLSAETGAKILTLSTGAVLTGNEFKWGVDFLSLMEENLEKISMGLSCHP